MGTVPQNFGTVPEIFWRGTPILVYFEKLNGVFASIEPPK